MSWAVFPNALSTLIQYLSLDWPKDQGWSAYNGLQLLAYFITVFIASPLALLTGLPQSPAISNRVRLAAYARARAEALPYRPRTVVI